MCAAHTDLARAQSANNQQVHSESDFFFFSKNFHSSWFLGELSLFIKNRTFVKKKDKPQCHGIVYIKRREIQKQIVYADKRIIQGFLI